MRLESEQIKIDGIYVPAKQRKTLNEETVEALAEDIMENGQQQPILVRWDGERFILVEGLHRLEACRALGEDTINGLRVQARMR